MGEGREAVLHGLPHLFAVMRAGNTTRGNELRYNNMP